MLYHADVSFFLCRVLGVRRSFFSLCVSCVVEYPRYTPVFCFLALGGFFGSSLRPDDNLFNGERATAAVASSFSWVSVSVRRVSCFLGDATS